ncbi:hypothetical protein HYW21_06460 [Candidatus Woesearchaeota archaeon]|nr:hypothetical protein [Candidatus Woesearchaeota archaeon]
MTSSALLKKYEFKEEFEEVGVSRVGNRTSVFANTGYPKAHHRYRLHFQSYNLSVEEPYFWILDYLRSEMGVYEIEKITDLFAASEHSAFFGNAQQRIGLQQDKVSQFLATIGKMVKELFQLVRELRVIDERLGYYDDSMTGSKSSESAEITLKGIWIDLVEQGSKNPASVYGMARELQFVTLPDLFFRYHPKNAAEVDAIVDKIEFNRKVREVLKRKLRSYMEWKIHTYTELKNKRKFTLKYLRQHYDVIRMYMTWVKPYLRNIRRLQMDYERTKSPDLIAAFEGSIIEIEIIAKKFPEYQPVKYREIKHNKYYYAAAIFHFDFRTKPSMNYQQEGYQRGPIHVGRFDLVVKGYAWKKKDIDNYKTMKEEEDFELLENIDASVKIAMEGLGDELKRYLKEAGEESAFVGDTDKNPPSQKKTPEGVKSFLGSNLLGIFSPPHPAKKGDADEAVLKAEKKVAEGEVEGLCFFPYKDYKKIHGILQWN